MYCLCVNVYCHRVSTQLQLTNISVSISISILILLVIEYHFSVLKFAILFGVFHEAVFRKDYQKHKRGKML
jgi:hypothetical protein